MDDTELALTDNDVITMVENMAAYAADSGCSSNSCDMCGDCRPCPD